MANRDQILNDAELSLRLALDGRQSIMWTALPCIVDSVDFDEMTIDCTPAIKGTIQQEDGTVISVQLPVLLDVPIVFPSAGGFILTMPIQEDDEVLVVFSSRCIDGWWQSGGIQMPLEMRMHDLSDGFAIPGPRSVPNVASSISTTSAQLRNDAGTTYMEISSDGKIKLISPTTITVEAPSIVLEGNVSATGTLVVTGAISGAAVAASGAISGGTVSAGGIDLSVHTHSAGSLTSPSGAVTGDTGAPL